VRSFTRADGERFVRTVKYNLWLCAQYGVEVSDDDLRRIVKWLIGEFYGERFVRGGRKWYSLI